jgi:hypothetical protein
VEFAQHFQYNSPCTQYDKCQASFYCNKSRKARETRTVGSTHEGKCHPGYLDNPQTQTRFGKFSLKNSARDLKRDAGDSRNSVAIKNGRPLNSDSISGRRWNLAT